MTAILKTLVDFVVAVFSLVINLITGIWQMLQMIPSALTMLTYSVAFMPTILIAFATALITISIVFLVVGR